MFLELNSDFFPVLQHFNQLFVIKPFWTQILISIHEHFKLTIQPPAAAQLSNFSWHPVLVAGPHSAHQAI